MSLQGAGWTFDPAPTSGFPLENGHYREMDASGAIAFGESTTDARRNLICNWNGPEGFANLDFVADLLGYATYTGAGTGVSRVTPDPHPENNLLFATTANRTGVTPSTVTGGVSTWSYAKFDTSYRDTDFGVAEDDDTQANELYRFVSRKTIPKGDYLQLAVNAFSWLYAGGNLGSVPGIIVPTKTLEYTWHMVPSKGPFGFPANQVFVCPTEQTILSLVGTTNSTVFDSRYPVGTILFVGAEATLVPPRFNSLYHWNIRYFFEQKDHGDDQSNTGVEIGVNHIYNNLTRKWDVPFVQTPDGNQFLYSYADLNQLFVLSATS